MKFLHHRGFRPWTEMEIMAIFLIAILTAMFLPAFLSSAF